MPKKHYLILLLPLTCAILHFTQDCFIYRSLVSLLCSIILIIFPDSRFRKRSILLVSAGLFISISADWFMGHSNHTNVYFIYGVTLFFIAHCCYLIFSLINGKMNYKVLVILLIVYLPIFFFLFASNINGTIIYIAILSYLLISALSLSAAMGLSIGGITRFLFALGIGTLIASDTVIGFNMFSPYHLKGVIMPTYFAFQLIITTALIKK